MCVVPRLIRSTIIFVHMHVRLEPTTSVRGKEIDLVTWSFFCGKETCECIAMQTYACMFLMCRVVFNWNLALD